MKKLMRYCGYASLFSALFAIHGCGADRWYATESATSTNNTNEITEQLTENQNSHSEKEQQEAANKSIEPEKITAPKPQAIQPNARGALPLRVEDAVMLAVAYNRDLAVRRYDSTIAATFADIERGRFDADVFAELSVSEEQRSQTSNSTGDRFDVESETRRGVFGIEQELPLGTDIALSISQESSESSRSPDQEETRVGLTITQALLEGAGPAVNLADIRQATIDADISRYELRAYISAMIADTEIAYWRLAQAEKQRTVVQESLRIAELQRDDVATRIELGAMPASAAAATRSEVARREQALIESTYQFEQALLRLQRLVTPYDALNFDQKLSLESEAAIQPNELGQLSERLLLAQRQRSELSEAYSYD